MPTAAPASIATDATVTSTAPSTTSSPPTSAAPVAAVQSTAPTTLAPVTLPPVDLAPIEPAPVDVVDVAGGTVFGIRTFDAVDVDAVIVDVSARLGSPTSDSGWQPIVGEDCPGSTDYRVSWWGDFRMTFERYPGDGVVRDELSAWTVGDPTLFELAPFGDVPAPSPSNIVTLEGIGLGSSLVDVEAVWPNIIDAGGGRLVGRTLEFRLDDTDRIIGFGYGPIECYGDEMR
jgi:hypothetical protein